MRPIHVRVLTMCAAAAAIALTGVVAGGYSQPSAGGSAPSALAAGGANTEALCHARGNGTFALLSVNANAVGGHLGHGDGQPLGEAPGGVFLFTSTCERVPNIAGTWLGESITFEPNSDPACGEDLNEYRLTLQQSGSDVSGEVYWKILDSYYPPDNGMEQTADLTYGNVSGNTFTFSYGPPEYGIVATATFTGTTMTGTIDFPGSCDPNTFDLIRQ